MQPIIKIKNGIEYIYWLDYPNEVLALYQANIFIRDGVKAFVESIKAQYRVFVELLK